MRIHVANPEFTLYVVFWARNYQKSQAHDSGTNRQALGNVSSPTIGSDGCAPPVTQPWAKDSQGGRTR
jgi:hypothetical protein